MDLKLMTEKDAWRYVDAKIKYFDEMVAHLLEVETKVSRGEKQSLDVNRLTELIYNWDQEYFSYKNYSEDLAKFIAERY